MHQIYIIRGTARGPNQERPLSTPAMISYPFDAPHHDHLFPTHIAEPFTTSTYLSSLKMNPATHGVVTRSEEDVLSTPLPGETLEKFYARSRTYRIPVLPSPPFSVFSSSVVFLFDDGNVADRVLVVVWLPSYRTRSTESDCILGLLNPTLNDQLQ